MYQKGKVFKLFQQCLGQDYDYIFEIYCYVNGFLKWNISKDTIYIVGNKQFFGKICIPYISNLSLYIKNKLSRNFTKSFVNNILTLSQFLIHSKLKIIVHIKTQFLMISIFSYYINLFVLAVVLAILVKLVVILKLGLRSISKRITSLIFLNIYTPPQHALTHIILFVLK